MSKRTQTLWHESRPFANFNYLMYIRCGMDGYFWDARNLIYLLSLRCWPSKTNLFII